MSITTGATRPAAMRSAAADAVEARHLHVEDDEVGAVLLGEAHRLLAVAGLADDGEALLLEHLLEVEPDERLVLRDHHPPALRLRIRLVGRSRFAVLARAGHGGKATERSVTQWQTVRRAPIGQLAEPMVSNTIQCGFESHSGHRAYVSCSVVTGVTPRSCR